MEEARVAKPTTAPQQITQPQVVDSVVSQSDEATNTTEPVDPNSPEERAELIPQDNWATSPLFYELANYLGVDSKDYDGTADQISVITDWAIERGGSNKVEDILHTIRELENKLQPPAWGERRVAHLYRALRMEARFEASKKALGAFTRTGKWDN